MSPEWPLIIAANRDEFYHRPTASPAAWDTQPPIFAGRDLVGGGTWLGVNGSGALAGLTNQPTDDPTRVAPLSRGALVIKALDGCSADEFEAWLKGQPISQYNPFNMLYGTWNDLRLAYGREDIEFARVPIGVSVLTNGRLDAPHFPKVGRIKHLCETLPLAGEALFQGLHSILADQTLPDEAPTHPSSPWPSEVQRRLHAVCVSTPNYGTRSGTIIAMNEGGIGHYLHADGPPAERSFDDLSATMHAAFDSHR